MSAQSGRNPSFSELLVDLGQDVSALVHDEIDLVKKETKTELRKTLLVMGSLAVLIIAAALTLCAAAVLALARVLDPPLAALAVGGAIAVTAVGVGLAASGKSPRPNVRSPHPIHVSKEKA